MTEHENPLKLCLKFITKYFLVLHKEKTINIYKNAAGCQY